MATATKRRRTTATAEKAEQRFSELGISGIPSYSGRIEDEFLLQLRGDRGRKALREFAENEPIAAACLGTIEQVIRSVPVDVQAGADERATELVMTALGDMSHTWGDHISEVLSKLIFGWSAGEIVYKRRQGDNRDPSKHSRYNDGLIGWRKIAPRSQQSIDRWLLDDTGGVQGMRQYQSPGARMPEPMPIEKLLIFRTKSWRGSPEGKSLLRGAWVPYHHLKHIRFVEGVGIERDLTGLLVLRAPAPVVDSNATGANLAAHNALMAIGKRIKRDEQEFLFLQSERDTHGEYVVTAELIASPGTRQFDTTVVIQRLQKEIALALLSDFVLLGHEKVGSFSLASSKTGIFALAVAGWLDSILAVWNRHAIPRLLRLNGLPTQDPPQLVHGDIETPDLAELGAYITALSGAGVTLFDPESQRWLLHAAGIPMADGEGLAKRRTATRRAALRAARKVTG